MQTRTDKTKAVENTRQYSTREVTVPSVKQQIFERFEAQRIRDISQTTRIRAEQIESVIREGIRLLRASGATVNFRCERSAYGRPVRREVAVMPHRNTTEAA